MTDQLETESRHRAAPPDEAPPDAPPLRGPMSIALQSALMAMSVWVLGCFLLGASYRVIGTGGIVLLLVTLVVVRLVAPLVEGD